MKKLSFLKMLGTCMLILASSQIIGIRCMEGEEQTSQQYTIYDTLSEENKATFDRLKAGCEKLKEDYERMIAEGKAWREEYEAMQREHEERNNMLEEDYRARDFRANQKRLETQRRRAWSHAMKTSAGITVSFFLGQIALGLKPQLLDIFPNCLAGLLIGTSKSTLTSLSTAALWMAYTTLRSYGQAGQYPYDHWLRSILTK